MSYLLELADRVEVPAELVETVTYGEVEKVSFEVFRFPFTVSRRVWLPESPFPFNTRKRLMWENVEIGGAVYSINNRGIELYHKDLPSTWMLVKADGSVWVEVPGFDGRCVAALQDMLATLPKIWNQALKVRRGQDVYRDRLSEKVGFRLEMSEDDRCYIDIADAFQEGLIDQALEQFDQEGERVPWAEVEAQHPSVRDIGWQLCAAFQRTESYQRKLAAQNAAQAAERQCKRDADDARLERSLEEARRALAEAGLL